MSRPPPTPPPSQSVHAGDCNEPSSPSSPTPEEVEIFWTEYQRARRALSVTLSARRPPAPSFTTLEVLDLLCRATEHPAVRAQLMDELFEPPEVTMEEVPPEEENPPQGAESKVDPDALTQPLPESAAAPPGLVPLRNLGRKRSQAPQ